jgi:hypothetical protein
VRSASKSVGAKGEVALAAPDRLGRQPGLGGLVVLVTVSDAVRGRDTGNPRLRAHRLIAELHVLRNCRDGLLHVGPIGVAVDHHGVPWGSAEETVDGHSRRLAEDVPEGRIDSGNGSHGDRTPAPIGALVEHLPDGLDAPRVAPDEHRHDVILEIARDGQLPTVERRVS